LAIAPVAHDTGGYGGSSPRGITVRVLFVKQDHASPDGLIGDAFAAAGCDVSEMIVVPKERFDAPDVAVTFPAAPAYDAVVFFGAVWSVYDTATIPWITAEIAYARSLISLGVPALGICFGGQMLAAAVGGQVEHAPVPEVGWLSVASSEPSIIDSGPWLSWHFDRFTVPAHVPVVAQTALANQAFTHGRTLGLQFHPEVTDAVLEAWLDSGGAAQLADLGVDPQELIEQSRTLADGAAARAHGLVRRFLFDVARRPAVAQPAAEQSQPPHRSWLRQQLH
jgi:GMP synthase-like glutamine amidotransferase